MKIFILSVVALIIGFTGITLLGPVTSVQAQDAKEAVCDALGAATSGEDCVEPSDAPSVNGVIRIALNILSFVAAVISVIMIIIGGLKFITSQGDSNSASSARNTIIYAVVGLVIVALSQIIVKFVVDESTTVNTIDKTSFPKDK